MRISRRTTDCVRSAQIVHFTHGQTLPAAPKRAPPPCKNEAWDQARGSAGRFREAPLAPRDGIPPPCSSEQGSVGSLVLRGPTNLHSCRASKSWRIARPNSRQTVDRPYSNTASNGIRHPATAGSASASWPRANVSGWSGFVARYLRITLAVGSTSQTTKVPASK